MQSARVELEPWEIALQELDAELAKQDAEWNERRVPLYAAKTARIGDPDLTERLGVRGCYRTMPAPTE
jgi:hypothetical protein